MGISFSYRGNAAVGEAIGKSLAKAGYSAQSDIGACDVVFVYSESQSELEDVFFEDKGLIQVARKGAHLVVLSASTPSFARELNAIALVNDLHSVEAPLYVIDVTRVDAFSDPSNLGCFLAGEKAELEFVEPLIASFVGAVEVVGACGSAQALRASYTIQMAAQLVSCMEAEALCRLSSNPSVSLGDFLSVQGVLVERAAFLLQALKAERFEGSYTTAMCMAEISAALMAADDIDLILPGAEACMHLLELLALIGGKDLNPAALSLVYAEEALCAKHGLDWTQAEQSYAEEMYDGQDCDEHPLRGDFPGGFGAYSSN
ncbi:MAG: NAD(P)-dependent oxidoreductase [Eggerthellaceae bacterium]|nr:NAD(P)-dependent oxidoreductase [Eggerthellaceae bacterium]